MTGTDSVPAYRTETRLTPVWEVYLTAQRMGHFGTAATDFTKSKQEDFTDRFRMLFTIDCSTTRQQCAWL